MRSSERIFLCGGKYMEIIEVKEPKKAFSYEGVIYIDGKRAPVNDFIKCDGKVYVSLEEVSMLNKKSFIADEQKQAFFLGEIPLGKHYINDACCPLSSINCEFIKNYRYNNKTYKNAMVFSNLYPEKPHFAEISYRLNGLYNTFSFELLKITDNDEDSTIFWIMGENLINNTYDLKKIESGQRIELDIRGRRYMRLYFLDTGSHFEYAIVNAFLE